MAVMEDLRSATIICSGGLNSSQNWLELSQTNPGVASTLVNFEPSLLGGYRRINGFTKLEETDGGEVDPSGAEGAILGLAIYDSDIIAMRKQQSGATYEFYKYLPSASWSKFTTGLTLSSANVTKVRYDTFNFSGADEVIFTDDGNNAILFDGTNWTQISPSGTGANFANAGGLQALTDPSICKAFEGHIFVAGDSTYPNVVAHSAPNAAYDWTSASGAGQINAGMRVLQIYPFRDKLFVFGEDRIKYITVSGTDFVIKDVTKEIGLRGIDSVVEVAGDLLFLSPDGIRPISATERIGDFELSTVSRDIIQNMRDLITAHSNQQVDAVTIRSKNQVRVFFSSSSATAATSEGVIGAIRPNREGGMEWEFGTLRGIKVSCVTSGFYGAPEVEVVLHGDYTGKVLKQEVGNSFDGEDVYAEYSTPYVDFGNPSIRKTPHSIRMFTKPEGEITLNTGIVYDWAETNRINPATYVAQTTGSPSVYGTGIYGTAIYDGVANALVFSNVQGSGHSMKISISTTGQDAPYTIHGFVIVYEENGYK